MKKKNKKPATLRGTDKVASVGTLLGAKKEVKNPTLSKKFFGTCSVHHEPGNKSILGEDVADTNRLLKQIITCYDIIYDKNSSAEVKNEFTKRARNLWNYAIQHNLIDFISKHIIWSANNADKFSIRKMKTELDQTNKLYNSDLTPERISHIYKDKLDYLLKIAGQKGYKKLVSTYSGKNKLSYPVPGGWDKMLSDFGIIADTDNSWLSWGNAGQGKSDIMLDLMNKNKASSTSKQDRKFLKSVGINPKGYREPKIKTKKSETKEPAINPETDREFLRKMGIKEEKEADLSYIEFKNAANAVEKICPVCGNKFKNVHDKNQKYCCAECENKGKIENKLIERFDTLYEII